MGVYETEISMAVSGDASTTLGALAAQLGGLKGAAGETETAISNGITAASNLKQAFVALVEFKLGEKLAASMDVWINKATEIQKIHNDMMQIGFGGQIADFDQQSRALSDRFKNLSIIEIQKAMRESIPIYGDATKAANESGMLVEFASTMKAKYGGEHGGEIVRQVQSAIKAAEESGAMKPEDVGAFLKNEQKMLFAFGEQVSPSSMLTVQRNLGAYQRDLSDHFRFGILPAMAINQGQRAGTELATAASKFVAGIRNSSTALETMLDLGLVKEDDLEFNDKHVPTRIKMGHKTSLADDMDKDPLMAVTKDLLPAIIGKYGNDPLVMRQAIARLAGDKSAISGITDLALNASRYEKDAANVERVDPNFDRYREQSGDYARQSVEAQKENMQVAFGAAGVGPMRDVMKAFADAEGWIAQQALKHPDISAFGTAMAGLSSVALQALGAITGGLVAARLLGVGGGAVSAGSLSGLAGSALGLIGKGGSALKGGLLGGAIYGAGSWGIDKLVPWLGGHSQEEHERLQSQGPAHFWSGLFGDAQAAEHARSLQHPISKPYGGGSGSWGGDEGKSWWHKVFGANDNGVVPVSLTSDSGSMTAFERAVAKGVAEGFGEVLAKYASGGSGSADIGGGGGGFLKASWSPDGSGSFGGGSGGGYSGGSSGRRSGGGGGGHYASLPTGGAGRGGDDPSLVARAKESWDFWKSKGASDSVAAGLLGMEEGENNFLANGGMFKGWGDGGAAYGSFMWHKNRRDRIFRETGLNVIGASHMQQLGAAYHEMTKGERAGFWSKVQGAHSPEEAARLGVYDFEGPKDKVGASHLRGQYGNHWYGRFHGSAPTVSAPPRAVPQPQVHMHNISVELDGDKLGRAVTKHQIAMFRHPLNTGGVDTRGSYASPGTSMIDAA